MSAGQRFRVGDCYFLVGYYDRELRFPYIRTVVYLGKNLQAGASTGGDRWYFKDAQAAAEGHDALDDDAVVTSAVDGLEAFVDFDGLLVELGGWHKRTASS